MLFVIQSHAKNALLYQYQVAARVLAGESQLVKESIQAYCLDGFGYIR